MKSNFNVVVCFHCVVNLCLLFKYRCVVHYWATIAIDFKSGIIIRKTIKDTLGDYKTSVVGP